MQGAQSDPVSPAMMATISARLAEIEAEETVRILLAVESGSRAWGFHSPDSDYDVRFVYVRPVEWHLQLGPKRDVIERPIDDELDLSGWDLGKALGLALRSNAVIAEWLQSPIVYRADRKAITDLTAFCRTALSRRPVTWHYLSLLERQHAGLIGPGGGVRLKRYFYCLRPALALRWMRLQGVDMPPMDMGNLIAGCDLPQDVTTALAALTERKKALSESGEEGVTLPELDRLIADERVAAGDWLGLEQAEAPRNDLLSRADAIHRNHVLATP